MERTPWEDDDEDDDDEEDASSTKVTDVIDVHEMLPSDWVTLMDGVKSLEVRISTRGSTAGRTSGPTRTRCPTSCRCVCRWATTARRTRSSSACPAAAANFRAMPTITQTIVGYRSERQTATVQPPEPPGAAAAEHRRRTPYLAHAAPSRPRRPAPCPSPLPRGRAHHGALRAVFADAGRFRAGAARQRRTVARRARQPRARSQGAGVYGAADRAAPARQPAHGRPAPRRWTPAHRYARAHRRARAGGSTSTGCSPARTSASSACSRPTSKTGA